MLNNATRNMPNSSLIMIVLQSLRVLQSRSNYVQGHLAAKSAEHVLMRAMYALYASQACALSIAHQVLDTAITDDNREKTFIPFKVAVAVRALPKCNEDRIIQKLLPEPMVRTSMLSMAAMVSNVCACA